MKFNIILLFMVMLISCNGGETESLKSQLKEQQSEIEELKRQVEQNSQNQTTPSHTQQAPDNSEKSRFLTEILNPTKFVYAEINLEMSVPHVRNSEIYNETENTFLLTNIIKVEGFSVDKENQIKDEARNMARLYRGMGRIKTINIDIKKFDSYSEASENRDKLNYVGPDVDITIER